MQGEECDSFFDNELKNAYIKGGESVSVPLRV